MNYRVIWNEAATDALQLLYNAALDQEGVINTVTRIGLELSARPDEAGESRDGTNRILIKYPLVVWYHVNDRLKLVTVFQVRLQRP